MTVRVRSRVGTAVVLWRGDSDDVGREHHVEWTVDEEVVWAGNTTPAGSASPALGEEGNQIVFRGRLSLSGEGTAVLEFADTHILFDLADPPPPDGTDGVWVELRVSRDSVSVWPYLV